MIVGRRGSRSCVTGELWVTGSVAVETPRDGQDTTGHNSIIDAYLARRANFTGNFANSTIRPIRFPSPSSAPAGSPFAISEEQSSHGCLSAAGHSTDTVIADGCDAGLPQIVRNLEPSAATSY